jgi:hydroxymethylbilane synthase
MKLRLGTRASLLAVAQSRLVAAELSKLHPQVQVELIAIEERGDKDTRTPLREVTDADFFNAALDDALISKQVDLCVHSYKDLSETRPMGIRTAAIPEREDPRDAILFHPRSLDKLSQGQSLVIGSSSARRQRHIADFLGWALPQTTGRPNLEFVDLRGPVDRRIDQLFHRRHDGVVLDGIVLAVAGLSRLYNDQDGYQAIARRLKPLRWMIAPLSAVPTASGQGALALECRSDDPVTAALLAPLDHRPTRAGLNQERCLLGSEADPESAATVVPHAEFGLLGFHRVGDSRAVAAKVGRIPATTGMSAFDANQTAPYYARTSIPLPADLATAAAIYVAHHRCVTLQNHNWPKQARVWVAGTTSWRVLAKQGIWVEGCSDHLGFNAMTQDLARPVFALPKLANWVALTHADAVAGWHDSGVGRVLPTYRNEPLPLPAPIIEAARAARHFFWSSPDQFQRLKAFISPTATHASGPGKTARFLRNQGIAEVEIFHSRHAWQQWLT